MHTFSTDILYNSWTFTQNKTHVKTWLVINIHQEANRTGLVLSSCYQSCLTHRRSRVQGTTVILFYLVFLSNPSINFTLQNSGACIYQKHPPFTTSILSCHSITGFLSRFSNKTVNKREPRCVIISHISDLWSLSNVHVIVSCVSLTNKAALLILYLIALMTVTSFG